MKISIIGAGFTGLSLAYYLSSHQNFKITVFEKERLPGGLATGFSPPGYTWPIDNHYHHLFSSDRAAINLATQIGQKIHFMDSRTAIYYQQKIYPFDTPSSLLKFTPLSPINRLSTGFGILSLKILSRWQLLENIPADTFIKKLMGKQSWRVIWQPLFRGKFANHYHQVPATWFWARIKKRSKKLGYPEDGFLNFAQKIADQSRLKGVQYHFNTNIISISPQNKTFTITTSNHKKFQSDIVVFTLSNSNLARLVPHLPQKYSKTLQKSQNLTATTLILSLKNKFLPSNIYWLNTNDPKSPFINIVEHTNLVTKQHYDNNHILYLGKYSSSTDPITKLSKSQILSQYLPFLKKTNPNFSKNWINNYWLSQSPHAQPLIKLNHHQSLLPPQTPIKNLFLANMEQIYPWDRGTNYAIESGELLAKFLINRSTANAEKGIINT
jgi:protoporphyrinogen oxidase